MIILYIGILLIIYSMWPEEYVNIPVGLWDIWCRKRLIQFTAVKSIKSITSLTLISPVANFGPPLGLLGLNMYLRITLNVVR